MRDPGIIRDRIDGQGAGTNDSDGGKIEGARLGAVGVIGDQLIAAQDPDDSRLGLEGQGVDRVR